MGRYGFVTVLFICVTHTTCQYYDFYAALQPIAKNTQLKYYDVTTRRPIRTQKNSRRTYADDNIQRGFESTTKAQKANLKKSFGDEVNNDIKYTQNTFGGRPGVKPVVISGPPITNKPPTKDFDVSPEIILGPDEDYISNTDKRRYLDLAESMCDKYKSFDVKQIQAIPLVPSPKPVSVNVSLCAQKIPLVVGGVVVDIKEYPHMALIGWPKTHSNGYSWKCGGSLVSDRFVLTAAHCAYQDKDNGVIIGPPRVVQLGSSYLNDPNGQVVEVAAVIRHPKHKLPKSYYDIALIKLVKVVKISEVIKPACLGTPPSPGESIIATGWGKTEFGGGQAKELRGVSIPVWDIGECRDALGTSRKIPDGPLEDTQICAGEMEGGKDTCQGDSGGPAQIQDGCIWRVVAVTSLGRACGAPKTPALYAIAHPVFIAAVIFSEENKQSNRNRNDYDNSGNNNNNRNTQRNNFRNNAQGNIVNSNTRTDEVRRNFNQNFGNQNERRSQNSGTAHSNGYNAETNYGSQNSRRNFDTNSNQNVNSNRNYANQNTRSQNEASVSVNYGNQRNDQTSRRNFENNSNQKTRNNRYETTTIKYSFDSYNQRYDTNVNNQPNYYKTDGMHYRQDGNKNNQNYQREPPKEVNYNEPKNYDYQSHYQNNRQTYENNARVWWT